MSITMFRTAILAVALACAFVSSAEARRTPGAERSCIPTSDVMRPCAYNPNFLAGVKSIKVSIKRERIANLQGKLAGSNRVAVADWRSGIHQKPARVHRQRAVETASYGAPSIPVVSPVIRAVSGLVAPLAAKVSEIQASCGSKVISGVRHTYIAGTRRISLHASGKAADVAGNPSCIYAHLTGWSGGYSTDYGRVAHVHISYDAEGGREMGVHFVHGGGHRTRYAHRRHHRYASAQ